MWGAGPLPCVPAVDIASAAQRSGRTTCCSYLFPLRWLYRVDAALISPAVMATPTAWEGSLRPGLA